MIKFICIHHTGVSRETQPAQFYAVNRYHRGKWDMISELGYYIGYNYFIGTNGVLTQTRQIGEETLAVVGHNHDTIHICIAGDFTKENPTTPQEKTLIECIKSIQIHYPDIGIKLHSEMRPNRTCPGFSREYLQAWILDKMKVFNSIDKQKADMIQQLKSLLDTLREKLLELMSKL